MARRECNVTDKEFPGSRRQKSFAKFVDKVIQEVPLPVRQRDTYRIKEPNDPVEVLRSRGLLTIDKNTITSRSRDVMRVNPGSEVDLTFYTEETRNGDPVKLFSSTHRLKDGKLIYTTTQEMAPPDTSDETVDVYEPRGYGMSNIGKDIKHKSNRPAAYNKKELKDDSRSHKTSENEAIHRSTRPRNRFTHRKTPSSDNEDSLRSPKQKAVYHAVWHHASPRKFQGTNSKKIRFRNATSSTPTKQNHHKWTSPLKTHHKISPPHCKSSVYRKSNISESPNVLVNCALRHRMPARQESKVQNRPFTNYIYNYHDHPGVECEESSNETEELNSVSVCMMRTDISPPFSEKLILCPVRSSADLDCGQGDYDRSKSSGSRTRISAKFYNCYDDERGSEDSDSLTCIDYSSNDGKAHGNCHRRGHEGSPRKQPHTSTHFGKPQKYVKFARRQRSDNSITTPTNTRCSCKCHRSRLDILEAERSSKKPPKTTKDYDEDDMTRHVIEQMVNKEALEEFAKKNSKNGRDVQRFNDGSPKKPAIEKRFEEWNKRLGRRDIAKDEKYWCSKEGYLVRSSVSMLVCNETEGYCNE